MNRVHLPVLVVLLAVAGCAGAPRAPSADATGGSWREIVTVNEKGETIVCQRERPTGSHILEMVCYRREDLDRSRAQTEDALRKLPSPPESRSN